MKKIFKFWPMAMMLLFGAVCFTACGDDDDDDSSSGSVDRGGSSATVHITPGWYESGDLKKYGSSEAQDILDVGDNKELQSGNWTERHDYVTAYHFIDNETVESVVGGISLNSNVDYFDTARLTSKYSSNSITLYFYYRYPFDSFTYVIEGNKVIMTDKSNPQWNYSLIYENGVFYRVNADGEKDPDHSYHKNSYNGRPW